MQKFVDVLLEKLEPIIKKLVDRQKPKFEELFKRKMDKSDEEMASLNLIYKLLFAIESYTLPTDKLFKINNIGTEKGYLTINVVVEREGQEYNLSTEVIGAGGYNIQDYHYRYLTNTKLPKKGGLEESKKIDKKIKSLTNIQKLEKEIDNYRLRIEKSKELIPKYEKYSDEQVLDAVQKEKEKEAERTGRPIYISPSWEEIVRRGADVNYDYSEVEYYRRKEEDKLRSVEGWRNWNITSNKRYLKDYEKTLKKLEAKLQALKGTEFEMGGNVFTLNAKNPKSISGRSLTPLPKMNYSTNRSSINSEKKFSLWLYNNALEEVKGDSYRTTLVKGLNPSRLSNADQDFLNLVLFNDTDCKITYEDGGITESNTPDYLRMFLGK